MSPLSVKQTKEFEKWQSSLPGTSQYRIQTRIDLLKDGHFGDSKELGDGLFELRWKNGLRIYFSYSFEVIMLWGGNKDTQYRDIRKARKLRTNYETFH